MTADPAHRAPDATASPLRMSEPARPVIALLGVGEAGASIGSDLVELGVAVRAWDPDPARAIDRATAALSPDAAAAGADVVLSINSATTAVAAAESVAAVLRPGQLYADLNSGSVGLKLAVAAVIEPTGAGFVDAALMDGVPGHGIRTRCLVSGPGADRFMAVFSSLGMPIEVVGDAPGAAASRKLLRSVFAKGLAAVTEEAIRAARAADCEAWLRGEIGSMLSAADEKLVDRFLDGSRRHAARRLGEMRDVRELLTVLGVEPRVTDAAIEYLAELVTTSKGTTDA